MTLPYSLLAPYYRSVMEHVDYKRWGTYLEKLLKLHNRFPKTMLEVGAGAGLLSPHFSPKSLEFRVTTDICYEMISQADKKVAGFLAVADATALPFQGPFDLILMTYDAINYLTKPQIQKFFKSVRSLLSPKGVFIFDAATEFNSENYFDDLWDASEIDDTFIARHSLYDFKRREQKNIFDFFALQKDGSYQRTHEEHTQYIYPLEDLYRFIKKAGLNVEAVYSEFSFSTDLDSASRLQFVVSAEAFL
jgi:SAM-dependent methyltransferase